MPETALKVDKDVARVLAKGYLNEMDLIALLVEQNPEFLDAENSVLIFTTPDVWIIPGERARSLNL